MSIIPHRADPPGGKYFYFVPETKTALEHSTMDKLLENVRWHYANNRLQEPENLRALVEHHMCLQMPPGVCSGKPEPGDKIRRIFRLAEVLDFSRLIFTRAVSLATRSEFHVSQEEADRRAGICAACPKQASGFCPTCDQLEAHAAPWLVNLDKQRTRHDAKLTVCSVCGCLLRAKVWISLAALAGQKPKGYPAWCWLSPGRGRMPTQQEIDDG